MSLAIIDYGSGNLRSVAKAFHHVTSLPVQVIRQPEALQSASHIVLPGVGAYGDCMRGLAALPGMLDALSEQVLVRGKPFLGICVGMQMLFARGFEHGEHAGLGWLEGEVVGIRDSGFGIREKPANRESPIPDPQSLKIPHMGWNELAITTPHPLLAGIPAGAHAYFVHSYHAVGSRDVIATTDYGQTIAAVVAKGNIMGTQFHPEKSQQTGLRLLKNFVNV
jgi:glutamine amidotransferase